MIPKMSVNSHILPFNVFLLSVIHSLIYMESVKIFLAWSLVLLTRIHISEWREMSLPSSSTRSLLVSTQSSSQLFKDWNPRWHLVTLQALSSWQTHQLTLRKRSTNMLSLVARSQLKNKSLKELILTLMFLINGWDSSWKTMRSLLTSRRSMAVVQWWQEKLSKFWLTAWMSSCMISKKEERRSLMKMSRNSWKSGKSTQYLRGSKRLVS